MKQLAISIAGRARPYLLDPQGKRIGIDPSTYQQANDFPEGIVNMGGERGSIVMSNPVNGQYTLQLKDGYAEDFQLIFSFQDGDKTADQSFGSYTPGSTISFTFTLNSAAAQPLQVSRSPAAPTGLRADPYTSGGLKTRLCWNASSDATVTGYKVYSKQEDEPILSPLATTAAVCYTTTDQNEDLRRIRNKGGWQRKLFLQPGAKQRPRPRRTER